LLLRESYLEFFVASFVVNFVEKSAPSKTNFDEVRDKDFSNLDLSQRHLGQSAHGVNFIFPRLGSRSARSR